ncbi:hypothetical protein V494_06022 [Pseudogymnoascus sp. VKM F-4513 (FW-928)]|nr:hypothetical protein V494_06022 [Pseudogymnoascus sp. VKM F-4513 (FW-928)]
MASLLPQQQRIPAQADSSGRAIMLSSNEAAEAHAQGECPSSGTSPEPDSLGYESNMPLDVLQENKTPFISFGEGADSTYRRNVAALSKYTRTLNGIDLALRLDDLPTESEYVPRKVRDPTPPSSIDLAQYMSSIDTTPSDYWQSPPEEVKLEREKALQRINRFYKTYFESQQSQDPTKEATATNHNPIEIPLVMATQGPKIPTMNHETGSNINGGHESEIAGPNSTSVLTSVEVPVGESPYVSFGDGADPAFKRIATATHKYVHGLKTHQLIGRLNELPEENEHVPRNYCYSPLTLSHDSDATPEFIPDDFPRLTSEEIIENERLRKAAERPFPAHFRYKRPSVSPHSDTTAKTPPISHESPKEQNSAQLHAKQTFPQVFLTSPRSQSKKSPHKTRSGRVEKTTRRSRNITAGSNSSQHAAHVDDLSMDDRPKRSKRDLSAADRPGRLATQAPRKADKAQKRLALVLQGPLRASRRLAGKRPEFDMLAYQGKAPQKREAPLRTNTDDVNPRLRPPPNRSPRDKKKGSSKVGKPQGIVKPEAKFMSSVKRQKKLSGS